MIVQYLVALETYSYRVSNSLDPNQALPSVRPDLGPNCSLAGRVRVHRFEFSYKKDLVIWVES